MNKFKKCAVELSGQLTCNDLHYLRLNGMMCVLLLKCCRYEWYQTETHVVVSVLVKNVKKEDLKCDIQESSVSSQIENLAAHGVDMKYFH